MKALFAFTARIFECNQHFYTNTLPSSIWQNRYLKIFDEVIVYARKVKTDSCSEAMSDCPNVTFSLTELGTNKIDLILKNKMIYNEIEALVAQVDFVIARMGFFGVLAARCARKMGKPYVCEVVGSSWDDLWNYSFFGKIAACWLQPQVKYEVKKAKYAIYVTQKYLQKEYPCEGKSIGISNVALQNVSKEILEKRIERIKAFDLSKPFILGTAAALDVPYKGQRFVIRAMKRLKEEGYCCKYLLAGNGNRDVLLQEAEKNGVADDIIFLGAIPHDKMQSYYKSLDVFILPSLQEGLPRAVIEAMQCALPVIGFRTAGIPELIDEKYVCPQKSIKDLFNIIKWVIDHNEEQIKIAKRNFNKSYDFLEDFLNKKRIVFYQNAIRESI